MPGAMHKSSEQAPMGTVGTEVAPKATGILIISAGAAGLSTAGALKKLGLASTVLEQDTAIGNLGAPL